MKQNKTIRERLEKQYGKGCMFKKANIEEKIEKRGTIKTFKRYLKEKRFRGKFLRLYAKQMNLHHLKHRSEGGKTTVENGAVVSTLAHMYMHSLPREQEEFINNELRKYKMSKELKVVFVDDLELPYTIKATEFKVNERKKEKYDRVKKKQEEKKLIDDYMEEER